MKRSKRLIRIGLNVLYRRKRDNIVKYMYRRVGQNPNERYSFRWQPQYSPNNVDDKEYLKKKTFSWLTWARFKAKQLPPSTTSFNWRTGEFSKKRPGDNERDPRNNWRAAHYFWISRVGGGLRMDEETEDSDELMMRVHRFYNKALMQHNFVGKSQEAVMDLLMKIKRQTGDRMGDIGYKAIIRSSGDTTARSTEEKLIYLAPHLHKMKSFKESPTEKKIVDKVKQLMPKRAGKEQQIDVIYRNKNGKLTPEGKMFDKFFKSQEGKMLGALNPNTKTSTGLDVTEKTLIGRFGEQTKGDKVIPSQLSSLPTSVKALRGKTAKDRFVALIPILQEMRAEINNPDTQFELRGQAQRRFKKDAKKKGYYEFAIPTGAGDILLLGLSNKGDKIGLSGGLIPDVGINMDIGQAAANQMLGTKAGQATRATLRMMSGKNQFEYDGKLIQYRNYYANKLLHVGYPGKVTDTPFAPTMHTNIMSRGDFVTHLSTLVNEAYGGSFQSGTWQDMFDPKTKFSNNNAFHQWAMDWIKESKALEDKVNKTMFSQRYFTWASDKVFVGKRSHRWAGDIKTWKSPASIRPFVYTSKVVTKQAEAANLTRQGAFTDFRTAMSSLFGTTYTS